MNTARPPSDVGRHGGKFYGKYRGRVVDNADPTKLGRVKVSVPGVFGESITVWAQACFQPGHFWVPPPETMVWVEFESGDPQFPIWTGTWYREGTTPTDADFDPPDGRVIHTRAGHTLRFHDKEGEEKIVIRHRADSFVSIDEKGSILVAANDGSYIFMNAETGETSMVSKDGHLVTLGGDAVTIANHDGSFIELKGDTVKVNAKATVQVVGKTVVLGGGSLQLGSSPVQFKLLLADIFGPLYAAHTHATALGPSGPPIPPYVPTTCETMSVTVQK